MSNNEKGKIVKIISNKSVVIDLGSEDGVKEDDIFLIFEETEEIKDSNGESLGCLEIIKAKVKATVPQTNMTICNAFETRTIEERSPSALMALQPSVRTEKRLILLNIDESEIDDNLNSPKIKIGDYVKKYE
jgi:hypothetical protein